MTLKHIAIIMDGNRRWAGQRGLSPVMGHWKGAEVLMDIVKAASEIGVHTLTVFAFSTENWGRSDTEIEGLMDVFEAYLSQKKDHMIKEGVKLESIGDVSKLPERVLKALNETKKATEHCNRINLVLALNYGGRNEIKRAISKMIDDKVESSAVTEKLISEYLDTKGLGDPELVIRTSGELRMSNFLLWQISYSEIYVTDVLWPEFTPQHLFEAALEYQKRRRRLGG